MKERANAFFEHAVKKLNQANEELFRPEEDIVTYTVCKNSQHAIENFLRGYLLKNDVDPGKLTTIDELYKECIKINKNFERVDFKGFDCMASKLDTRYCEEPSKVRSCFDIADNLDTFLRKEKIIS